MVEEAVARRLRKVVRPVLDTEKRVEVAKVEVVEAMAKRVVSTEVEAACTPSVANWDVDDPTVSEPRLKELPVVVAPPLMVRPPACAPLPMVLDAEETKPAKVESPVTVSVPLCVALPETSVPKDAAVAKRLVDEAVPK